MKRTKKLSENKTKENKAWIVTIVTVLLTGTLIVGSRLGILALIVCLLILTALLFHIVQETENEVWIVTIGIALLIGTLLLAVQLGDLALIGGIIILTLLIIQATVKSNK